MTNRILAYQYATELTSDDLSEVSGAGTATASVSGAPSAGVTDYSADASVEF